MKLALSRRSIYILAAIAVVGGGAELLGGHAETSTAAISNAPRPAKHAHGSRDSTLTPGAAAILMALAHRKSDDSASASLFAAHSWYIAPPPPPPPPPVPPAVPTAPPFPYTFLGSYTPTGEKTVYFLTRNDRVYDVHVGDNLDSTYSVDGAAGGQLQITYLPLKIKQTLAVGGDF